jgi:hypothetical protein
MVKLVLIPSNLNYPMVLDCTPFDTAVGLTQIDWRDIRYKDDELHI